MIVLSLLPRILYPDTVHAHRGPRRKRFRCGNSTSVELFRIQLRVDNTEKLLVVFGNEA